MLTNAIGAPIDVVDRLEPVEDRFWIERLDGAQLVLRTPTWVGSGGPGCPVTVFKRSRTRA